VTVVPHMGGRRGYLGWSGMGAEERRSGKERLMGLNQVLFVGSSLRPLNWEN